MPKSTKTAAAAKITRNPANASTSRFTLAQLLADIHAANKNATVTAKSARVRLRREFAANHTRNDAWTFPRKDYARIRSMFDAPFAAANAKPPRAPRAKKAPVEKAPVVA